MDDNISLFYGSEPSNDAADYAVEMARKYNSELIALHVILSDVTLFGSVPPAHMNEIKNEAQKYLDKIREKYYEVNFDIPVGNIKHAIKIIFRPHNFLWYIKVLKQKGSYGGVGS